MSRAKHVGPFVLWIVSAALVAIAAARLSVWIQPHFAPVVVYPVLMGAVLGALFAGLAFLSGVDRSRARSIAVVLLALAAALLEHGFYYRDYRESFEQARERGQERLGFPLPDVEPESFGEYLRSHAVASGGEIVLWFANPLLTASAAGVVFWYLTRKLLRSPE